MKLKKLPIIIIGILVIFIVSFLIRELIIYNDGKLDKSNYVPREEIITLLNKGAIITIVLIMKIEKRHIGLSII